MTRGAMQMRLCECGGLPKVHTERVAEDLVETWVQCSRCPRRTEEIEDFRADYATAEWQWNRGDLIERAFPTLPTPSSGGE